MQCSSFPLWIAACLALFTALSTASATEEEAILLDAGLPDEGPALLRFFQARAQSEIERESLRVLLRQFAEGSRQERERAKAKLLGLGPLALPAMRQTSRDLDRPQLAERAAHCLPWLEGPKSSQLLLAAIKLLARHNPKGAAEALLSYLPFALDDEVFAAVNRALIAVAASDGKPDAALLRGLKDPIAVRRAAAGVALCKAVPSERVPEVRELLHDPAAAVRLRAALALAEANDVEAISVLIDLLAELDAAKRQPVEEVLTRLAGEWAPRLQFDRDDAVSRRIRRDAWASWWRNSDGPVLLDTLRAHTLDAKSQRKIAALLARLGAESFAERERASKELRAQGRIALPQLQEASKHKDPEVARRAAGLIERMNQTTAPPVPLAVLRLLAVRKPAEAVEALLAYLPNAEDESRSEEARKALTVLAQREGKPHPALLRALSDDVASRREAAIQALTLGGGAEGRTAVRKLLTNDNPLIRLRAALALAAARQREGIPVLIDLLAVLPAEQSVEIVDVLSSLAGDSAPKAPTDAKPAERRKYRDAWAAWWKVNAERIDLSRLAEQSAFGFTLICDSGNHRVYEIDRYGKTRWSIANVGSAVDAWSIAGKWVLTAEPAGNRIVKRDLQGNILWQRQLKSPPMSAQPLPDGHVFIAVQSRLFEVDRDGKEVYSIDNIPGKVWEAYRMRSGEIVCLTTTNQCLILDKSGKQLHSFASNHGGNAGSLNVSANGRILVAQPHRQKVVEFDRTGKVLHEVDAPSVTAATALPNGHILVASQPKQCVYELDRAGKMVWEHKNAGKVFRARRR